jgi:protein required for attachment to host cells
VTGKEHGNEGQSEHKNKAEEEYLEVLLEEAHRKAKAFGNTREAILDVLFELEREFGENVAKKLKKRALSARSLEELEIITKSIVTLGMFNVGNPRA